MLKTRISFYSAAATSPPSRGTQLKGIIHLPVCNPIEGSIPSNVTPPWTVPRL